MNKVVTNIARVETFYEVKTLSRGQVVWYSYQSEVFQMHGPVRVMNNGFQTLDGKSVEINQREVFFFERANQKQRLIELLAEIGVELEIKEDKVKIDDTTLTFDPAGMISYIRRDYGGS